MASSPISRIDAFVLSLTLGGVLLFITHTVRAQADYHLAVIDLSGLERGGRVYFVTIRFSGQVQSYMVKLV